MFIYYLKYLVLFIVLRTDLLCRTSYHIYHEQVCLLHVYQTCSWLLLLEKYNLCMYVCCTAHDPHARPLKGVDPARRQPIYDKGFYSSMHA